MHNTIEVCAFLSSPALSARLAQLCALQGWKISHWDTGSETLPGLGSSPDIIFFDHWARLDELLSACVRSGQSLLAYAGAETSAQPASGAAQVMHIDPAWPDSELLARLINALNVARFEAQFFRQAEAEPITNLPHHSELMEYMNRHHGEPTGLVVVQIDHSDHLYANLDPVSRTDLLGALSRHFGKHLPHNTHMAIFDAGCFAVWCPHASEEGVRRLAAALTSQNRLTFKDGQLHFTSSAGYAFAPALTEPGQLWQSAWSAKEHARRQGGAQLAAASDRDRVSEHIPGALQRDEFSLLLQPQWDVQGTTLRGVESLLRWQGMEVGNLAPDHFIPIAERSGQMARVGDWVLERAACESATWLEHLIAPIFLGINVSPQQFFNDAIKLQIERLARDQWLDPAILELELSHNNLLNVVDQHRGTLYQLRDSGVRIAIDNLGTQLVDTRKLLRCPADTLKLDRSVVAQLEDDSNARRLVAQICELGLKFQLRVVAVGVETAAQLQLLEELGCTDVQGYLLSQPVPLERFHSYLADNRERKKSA